MSELMYTEETSGQTTVVLVDDHSMVREAISAQIQEFDDLEVLGTAPNCTEAISLCQQLQPDVVIFDIEIPGPSAFEACKTLLKTTRARILYLSSYSRDRYLDAAIASGGSGYVLKEEPIGILATAIRESAEGSYFSEGIRDRLAEVSQSGSARDGGGDASRISLLTERELEVLRHLARGHSKKQISEMIGKSYSTVDKRVSGIMDKLQIHDRVALARFAIREGIVEP